MIRRFFFSRGEEHDDEGGRSTNRKRVFFRASVALLGALAAAAVFTLVVLALPEDEGTAEAEDQETPSEAATAQDNPFRIIMQDSPSGDKGRAEITAKCPEGYATTGGGFDVHREWRVRASLPAVNTDGKGGGWVVNAAPDSNRAKPFTAYAVCAPESMLPGISYVKQSNRIAAGNKATDVVPKCSSGQAIGGGYRWSWGPGSFALIRSQPNYGDQLRSWLVTAFNSDTSKTSDVDAWAICVPNGVLKSLEPKSANVKGKSVINVNSPTCPKGTYLLGGGAGVPNDQPWYNIWSHIRPAGGNQPNNWSVGLENTNWSTRDVYSIAMCGGFSSEETGA